jgi:hypothetical protein
VQFLAGAKPGSDASAATVVCHRRIVVRDGLIEVVALFQHPMIAPLIGSVFPVKSSGRREFKTVRFYAIEGSLVDILSRLPGW